MCPSSCTASFWRRKRDAGRLARDERRVAEAGRRDDRGAAAELRLAEHEGQNRDEEVGVRHAEDPVRAVVALLKPRKDPRGGILASPHVERVPGRLGRDAQAGWKPVLARDAPLHALEQVRGGVPDADPQEEDLTHAAAPAGAAASPASGSRTVIVVPSPRRLCAFMEPPCFSTTP